MQIWLISFRPRFVLTAANQSLAGPRSDPATVHAPLFVPQRFNRIEICGAHCWEHPTYHADQSENRSRDQQNLGRNDQGDIRGLGVFSEPVKGQRSDCTTAREPRTRERVDVYADFSCAGDFVNKISKTNNPAPITMALSATLNAGH